MVKVARQARLRPANRGFLRTRHRGGFVINSAVSGMIACRALYPWDEWHGGEALGVKILEVVNAPAASVVVGLELISLGGYWLPACQWSWILAAVFLTLSSTQWWLIGLAADAARRRWRGGRSRDVLRPAP